MKNGNKDAKKEKAKLDQVQLSQVLVRKRNTANMHRHTYVT